MSMFQKTATAKFGKEPAMVEEVYSGFLHKSPGQLPVLKSFKSWKHRFFVLSKTDEDAHHLTYYSNKNREKHLGMINLSKISLMFIGVEKHQMWDWIQKNFKCPPASVLFLRVNENTPIHRDYFLIGENSDDVDGWHNALVKALKTQKSSIFRHTDETLQDNRFRSISEPEKCPESKVEDHSNERWPSLDLMSSKNYNPGRFSEPPVPVERKISVKEDKDEKDGEQDESPEISSEYMRMASVQMALEDDKQEAHTACTQTKMSTDEIRSHSQSCLLNFNGNCASTELDVVSLNNSVSECRQIQDSHLFHKVFNDLLIDTVEEIHTYIRRLSKLLHSESYK